MKSKAQKVIDRYPVDKNGLLTLPPDVLDRLWSGIDKNGPVHPVLGTPCWPWTSTKGRRGSSRFGLGGELLTASRVLYMVLCGPIPETLLVCHKCDNPPCMNPEHFFIGTAKDNMVDMSLKGRARGGSPGVPGLNRGSTHGGTHLVEADVIKIRRRWSEGEQQIVLAREYHVSPTALNNIIHRASWKHVA